MNAGTLVAAALAVFAGAALAKSRSGGPGTDPVAGVPDAAGGWPLPADQPAPASDDEGQGPNLWDQALTIMDPTSYIPANVDDDTAQRNLRAALDTIRWCEGTLNDMGYRTMFGYRYFDSFADHPRQFWPFYDQLGNLRKSSAAGAYQIIVATWDRLRAKLGLPDFSPASQDAAAIELIRECGALEDAKAGRIESVASKCRSVWASLPGSNVAQPTKTLDQVVAAFTTNGGTLA